MPEDLAVPPLKPVEVGLEKMKDKHRCGHLGDRSGLFATARGCCIRGL